MNSDKKEIPVSSETDIEAEIPVNSDIEAEIPVNSETDNETEVHFIKDSKYLSISIYALFVIFFGGLIIKLLADSSSIIAGLKYTLKILSPFIWGFGFAFVLSPLVNWLNTNLWGKLLKKPKHKKLNFYLSILVTYIVLIGALVTMLVFIIPQIYSSLVELINTINTQYFVVMEQLNNLPDEWHGINFESIQGMIERITPEILGFISTFTTNLIPIIYSTSLSIFKGLWNVLLGLIISVYMLGDKESLKNKFDRLLYAVIPVRKSRVLIKIGRESGAIFSNYITGKTLDSLIICLICFIAMKILQLDFSLLISILVGITNMIPYFGPFIGGGIGALILLIKSPISAIVFGVLILVIQQFDGLYLGPKILGDSIGLKPLWVIFGISIGGSLFGVIGMLIGVPVVAVLGNILNTFVEYRLSKRSIHYEEGKAISVQKNKKS